MNEQEGREGFSGEHGVFRRTPMLLFSFGIGDLFPGLYTVLFPGLVCVISIVGRFSELSFMGGLISRTGKVSQYIEMLLFDCCEMI